MPVANKITMLLYQATLVVMLLMDNLLHVLGLRVEDTSEYRTCSTGVCYYLCAARPSLPCCLFVYEGGRYVRAPS